ncbi:hypothetical protein Poli38472_001645 [Pythium oligandrum]|uniref:Protein kinase domain-containing protein n=1 Tax=Pythium oligandrum TaxID=41045 RepID=A0A8K1CTY2_PYTOL|nr:hypothetical protein Poli38472_001645 [Pythium oligandrum]|eukprot:TMW69489.1 hypothetical protein Poli38472_001645 [Pythium oligandrum]
MMEQSAFHQRRKMWASGHARALAALVCIALCGTRAVVHADCPLKTSALTSECGDTCFEGRPCFAYAANANTSSCVESDLTTCRENEDSECSYACFKYSPNDLVEKNGIDYTALTFLIPFGNYESKWEQKWNETEKENVKKTLSEDDTGMFPSMSNEVLKNIDKLSFLPSMKSLTIAGGSSVQGIRGKVADVTLATSFLDGQTNLKSVTLANLQLAQIPPTSFPPQLANITLTNCVLNQFPEDLLSMTDLHSMDLSQNYLKAYPAKFSFTKLEVLNMSRNTLESFDGSFPSLTVLDLSNNIFSSIPTAVFNLTKLKTLDLRNNSFTDLTLSQSQFEFLSNLSTLSVDSLGSSSCDAKYQKTLGGVQICLEGGSDNSNNNNNNSNTNQESSDSSSNAGLIGGIIGGIGGGIVVALIVLFVLRRRRGLNDKLSGTGNTSNQNTSAVQTTGRESASIWQDQELQSLKVNPDEIEDVRKLGAGAFCVVYLVKYRQTRLAASKRLKRDEIDFKNTQRFIDEIKLVSRLDHPRIVSLIGVSWTIESDLQALFEYMESGDLRMYVESPATGRQWSREKVQIAMDIVEALVYVHSFTPALVHRDLKSRNVLLDGEARAKLSDFGIARFRSEVNTMTTGVGTGRWLAPEVIAGSSDYDQSSDMFAFGVVLSELDTHDLPYEDIRGPSGNRVADVALLQMVAAGKIIPTFSQQCPPDIHRLALRCLAFERRDRPTAVEVAYALRTIMREESFLRY